MTEAEERRQIARNANALKKAERITKAEYNTVRMMLIMDFIEKKIFGKYPETKGQK